MGLTLLEITIDGFVGPNCLIDGTVGPTANAKIGLSFSPDQ